MNTKPKIKQIITKYVDENGETKVRVERTVTPPPPPLPKPPKPPKPKPLPKPRKVKPPKPKPKAVVGAADPLRGRREISKVEHRIGNHPRNRALFSLGMNWALRGGDLVAVKLGDVRGKQVGDPVQIREQKTGKVRVLTVNENVYNALQPLLEERKDAGDDEFLFVSENFQGKSGHITREGYNKLLKQWCAAAELPGQYSTHSLRKTRGYMLRTEFKVPLELIQKMYGHSTSELTLRYCGITQDEVKACDLIGI